ncbi:hypothetical protein [Blastococcus sp. CCUG 61487]|uniref:hypothetical protein n=1 Tax=Blastococcus sp. CCUG 61487 TaxID=1840703 RepID=UPI001485643A|nr:hypothetical protein [Blastococcus sp. CCUG 61487]
MNIPHHEFVAGRMAERQARAQEIARARRLHVAQRAARKADRAARRAARLSAELF